MTDLSVPFGNIALASSTTNTRPASETITQTLFFDLETILANGPKGIAEMEATVQPIKNGSIHSVEGHEAPVKAVNGGSTQASNGVDHDGRATPIPSTSKILSGAPVSPSPTLRSSLSSKPVIPSNQLSSASSLIPPAVTGLGTLQGEEQLKSALQSKDRIFVVMLSKEIEAFIQRVTSGDIPKEAQSLPPPIISALNLTAYEENATVKVQSQAASKFQRMLVYKAAEWYGLKAINGPEAVIYMGIIGSLPEKSSSLRLSNLVPERESNQQKFQIMQRSQPKGPNRSTSTDGGEGGPSSRKTLEQREAEYAAAREKIYGSDPISQPAGSVASTSTPSRVVRLGETEELDSVSRFAYGAGYEPVYPSLYQPANQEIIPTPQTMSIQQSYGHPPNMGYTSYQQMTPTMAAFPSMNNGYAGGMPSGQPTMPQQGWDANGNPVMIVPMGMQGYGMSSWNQGGMNGQMIPPPMMPPDMATSSAWSYNQVQTNGNPAQFNRNMYSQGMQQQQQQQQPRLMHPQPHRPQAPQHHSSSSSSISSHSHHSYPISRPHSRGSATSSRSTASSVRFGAMYPAHGSSTAYRQKGIMANPPNGVNGLTSLGVGMEKRRTRGQSPSSTTTTSSRSSRKAQSIVVPPTSQHPLPQRPDWAANNIPYQPSAIPLDPNASISGSDFPPLQTMAGGLAAAPIQSEKYKSRTNGMSYQSHGIPDHLQTPTLSNMPGPSQSTQIPSYPPSIPEQASPELEYRRTPSRPSASLYDPSSAGSRPSSVNTNRMQQSLQSSTSSSTTFSGSEGMMSPEDLIEAKLQALSVTAGVAIGPPPTRGGGPSYAKVVRRD